MLAPQSPDLTLPLLASLVRPATEEAGIFRHLYLSGDTLLAAPVDEEDDEEEEDPEDEEDDLNEEDAEDEDDYEDDEDDEEDEDDIIIEDDDEEDEDDEDDLEIEDDDSISVRKLFV